MGDIDRFFTAEATDPEAVWEEWKKQNEGKSTPILYQGAIDFFLKFNKIDNLTELRDIHAEALSRVSENVLNQYIVHNMIKKTVNHRVNEGISGTHAKSIKSAVTKFLQLCGFMDFTLRLTKGTGKKNNGTGSNIISPSDLRTVVDLAPDLMKKALILTLKDSGLRIGDIINLDHGDL
ncbi:MAG: hypothetical protein NWE89_12215, partial [Candidatus Bathyarchaeota archaeon]|nr:hypothetical protein [Candidatus Bathyarchaeota archaeon]